MDGATKATWIPATPANKNEKDKSLATIDPSNGGRAATNLQNIDETLLDSSRAFFRSLMDKA